MKWHSVFVNDIIKSVKSHPWEWKRESDGLTRGEVHFCNFGEMGFINTTICEINGHRMPLTRLDKWRLMAVYRWWRKNIPLNLIKTI